MACNLDKYATYEIAEVIKDGGRNIARLAHPPASCPEGALNNSKTTIIPDAKVDKPTLAFSTKEGHAIILMPYTATVVERVDPTMVERDKGGLGFWWVPIIIIIVALAYWAWQLWEKANAVAEREKPRDEDFGLGTRSGRFSASEPNASSAPRSEPLQPHQTAPLMAPSIVHNTIIRENDSLGGLGTGLILGSMLSSPGRAEHHSHRRDEDDERARPAKRHEKEEEEPASFSSDDDSDAGNSSDSDSSYSSDDSGSFSSDDSGGGSFGDD